MAAEDRPGGLMQSGLSLLKGIFLGEEEKGHIIHKIIIFFLGPGYSRGEPQLSEMDSTW